MKRRTALKLLFTGFMAQAFAHEVFVRHARGQGVTWNEKGLLIDVGTSEPLDLIPRVLTFELGEIETIQATWRGKTVKIPMEEVWKALGKED